MDQPRRPRGARRWLSRMSVVACASLGFACTEEPVASSPANYRADAVNVCTNRTGLPGPLEDERAAGGTRYRVRTPANYDPAIAHPLLVVYPGAGQTGSQSERHTGLTPAATAAGFIVAYVDHRRLSLTVLDDFATIPGAIARRWCVDETRIYVTGHSDGGTAAAAMAFRDDDNFTPDAIAPSAAGITAEDLAAYDCPTPLPVYITHSDDDKLFPGFGRSAANWWADCNGCSSTTHARDDGCIAFAECPANAPVRYCAGSGGHRTWPDRNARLLKFLAQVGDPDSALHQSKVSGIKTNEPWSDNRDIAR